MSELSRTGRPPEFSSCQAPPPSPSDTRVRGHRHVRELRREDWRCGCRTCQANQDRQRLLSLWVALRASSLLTEHLQATPCISANTPQAGRRRRNAISNIRDATDVVIQAQVLPALGHLTRQNLHEPPPLPVLIQRHRSQYLLIPHLRHLAFLQARRHRQCRRQ